MRKNEVICSVRPAEEREGEEHNFSLSPLRIPMLNMNAAFVWIAFRPLFCSAASAYKNWAVVSNWIDRHGEIWRQGQSVDPLKVAEKNLSYGNVSETSRSVVWSRESALGLN